MILAVEFPGKRSNQFAQTLPRETPAQLRLARELKLMVKDEQLAALLNSLSSFISERSAIESPAWAT